MNRARLQLALALAIFAPLACTQDTYNPGDPSTPEFLARRVLDCSLNPYCAQPSLLPPAVSGLALWLRADTITGMTDGAAVSSWSDESGNGRNATQSLGAAQPMYKTAVLNGLPVIRFVATGTKDRLILPEFITFTDLTIIAVLAGTTDTAATQFIFHETGVDANERFFLRANATNYGFAARTQTGILMNQFDGTGREAAILGGQLNGTTLRFALNGIVHSTENPTYTPISTWTSPFNSPLIGGNSNAHNSTNLNGDLAEIVMYNRAIQDWERSAVECYLSAKYAITVQHSCGG